MNHQPPTTNAVVPGLVIAMIALILLGIYVAPGLGMLLALPAIAGLLRTQTRRDSPPSIQKSLFEFAIAVGTIFGVLLAVYAALFLTCVTVGGGRVTPDLGRRYLILAAIAVAMIVVYIVAFAMKLPRKDSSEPKSPMDME